MALSFAHYTGTGAQTTFEVPFEYLAKGHVKVKVDGVPVTPAWHSTYTVQIVPAPAAGVMIEVRRETPRNVRLVNFSDGSTLVQSDLNTDSLQAFFLAQESYDLDRSPLTIGPDGDYDAGGRRVVNVGYPQDPTDVATAKFVDDRTKDFLVEVDSRLAHADGALSAALATVGNLQSVINQTAAHEQGARDALAALEDEVDDAQAARAGAELAQAQAAASAAGALASKNASDATRAHVDAVAGTVQAQVDAVEGDRAEVAGNASLVEMWTGQASASEAAAQTYANSAHSERLQAQAAVALANAARDAAMAAFDDFDDKYLGAKLADPTLDNDGNPLIDGAIYWNGPNKQWRAYDLASTQWYALAATTNASLILRVPTATLAAPNVADALNELDDKKAPKDGPTFTGTVSGITKAMVGLNNANNTADANKPVSIATQAALDLKADASALTSGLAGKANTSHQHAATDITSGTLPDARLPGRLGIYCQSVADANLAVTNGWWMGASMANAPTAEWFLIEAIAHNNQWVTQTAHAFSGDNRRYRREMNGAVWGSWYPLLSEAYTVSSADPSGSATEGSLWFKV